MTTKWRMPVTQQVARLQKGKPKRIKVGVDEDDDQVRNKNKKQGPNPNYLYARYRKQNEMTEHTKKSGMVRKGSHGHD